MTSGLDDEFDAFCTAAYSSNIRSPRTKGHAINDNVNIPHDTTPVRKLDASDITINHNSENKLCVLSETNKSNNTTDREHGTTVVESHINVSTSNVKANSRKSSYSSTTSTKMEAKSPTFLAPIDTSPRVRRRTKSVRMQRTNCVGGNDTTHDKLPVSTRRMYGRSSSLSPQRPQALSPITVGTQNSAETSFDFFRVRSFKRTRKGIVNKGDELCQSPSFRKVDFNEQTSKASCTNLSQLVPNTMRIMSSSMGSIASHLKEERQPAYTIRIVGAPRVGKSKLMAQLMTSDSLLQRGVSISSEDEMSKTVIVKVEDVKYYLTFIDSLPTADIDALVNINHMSATNAYIVVYAINDRKSFVQAVKLLDKIRDIATADETTSTAIILVANKTDLVRLRRVTVDEGKNLALFHKGRYFEVSTAFNVGLDNMLVKLTEHIGAQQLKFTKRRQKEEQKNLKKSNRSIRNKNNKNMLTTLFRHLNHSKSCEDITSSEDGTACT